MAIGNQSSPHAAMTTKIAAATTPFVNKKSDVSSIPSSPVTAQQIAEDFYHRYEEDGEQVVDWFPLEEELQSKNQELELIQETLMSAWDDELVLKEAFYAKKKTELQDRVQELLQDIAQARHYVNLAQQAKSYSDKRVKHGNKFGSFGRSASKWRKIQQASQTVLDEAEPILIKERERKRVLPPSPKDTPRDARRLNETMSTSTSPSSFDSRQRLVSGPATMTSSKRRQWLMNRDGEQAVSRTKSKDSSSDILEMDPSNVRRIFVIGQSDNIARTRSLLTPADETANSSRADSSIQFASKPAACGGPDKNVFICGGGGGPEESSVHGGGGCRTGRTFFSPFWQLLCVMKPFEMSCGPVSNGNNEHDDNDCSVVSYSLKPRKGGDRHIDLFSLDHQQPTKTETREPQRTGNKGSQSKSKIAEPSASTLSRDNDPAIEHAVRSIAEARRRGNESPPKAVQCSSVTSTKWSMLGSSAVSSVSLWSDTDRIIKRDAAYWVQKENLAQSWVSFGDVAFQSSEKLAQEKAVTVGDTTVRISAPDKSGNLAQQDTLGHKKTSASPKVDARVALSPAGTRAGLKKPNKVALGSGDFVIIMEDTDAVSPLSMGSRGGSKRQIKAIFPSSSPTKMGPREATATGTPNSKDAPTRGPPAVSRLSHCTTEMFDVYAAKKKD